MDLQRDEWAKLEYQGVLAIYLRDITDGNSLLPLPSGNNSGGGIILSGKDIYNYGLIIMNRMNPDNFSMGLVPNEVIKKRQNSEPVEDRLNSLETMEIEIKDELVIIKNLKHEIFGIWIHTIADRQNIYELIKYLLENEPKDSFE